MLRTLQHSLSTRMRTATGNRMESSRHLWWCLGKQAAFFGAGTILFCRHCLPSRNALSSMNFYIFKSHCICRDYFSSITIKQQCQWSWTHCDAVTVFHPKRNVKQKPGPEKAQGGNDMFTFEVEDHLPRPIIRIYCNYCYWTKSQFPDLQM